MNKHNNERKETRPPAYPKNKKKRRPVSPRKPTKSKTAMPSPEEWAREQLKNAPERTEEWAREVARIYLLDIVDNEQ